MATSSDLASRLRSAWPALLVAVCLGGGLVAPCEVRGESITASDFKIDLASNPAWINNSQPAVGLKLWRQTAMEQAVLASRPYVVVTNNSTGGAIQSFQLNLSSRPATAVTGCVWDAAQQASTWSWSPSLRTAVFNFATPIQSGQSFTLRLATGPRSPDPNAYTLQQNFFAPGQTIFGEQTSSAAPGYGVLGLTVTNPPPVPAGAMVAATSTTTTGSASQFTYPLNSVVIDSFSTYGQQVGITIAPVPEPSGIVLLAAAGCVGVAALRIRRRSSRTQSKTPCHA